MGKHGPGVDVDRMASWRLDQRDVRRAETVGQVRRLGQPVCQVGFVETLPQPDGHGLQVAARQAAIRGEALAQNQLIAHPAVDGLVVHRQQAADVDDGVFLGAHRCPVRQRKHLARDLHRRAVGVARFAQLDEVGVLGETAGVDEERDSVAPVDGADGAQVLH